LSARLRQRERILKQEAAGTVVLLDLDGGQYFSLDDAGSRVWDLCDGRRSVAEIVGILRGEYEAPAETIERDVIELLNDLTDEKLLDEDRPKTAVV
jgi:coenzyme PQQ biosynthesis protein PqqD